MVSAAQLRLLVEVSHGTKDADLQPFLDVAALIRSEDLAGSGLSSDRLNQIELYLAAHFYTTAKERGGLTSSKVGQSTDQFRQIKSDLQGLSSTSFGQAVLSLDTSGTLAASMSAKKARFQVVRSVQPPKYGSCY
jgi:hypothetical protein